jgi:diguanylate cyclase (GGDEF)-like protein/PAS domain S-box-containing protein
VAAGRIDLAFKGWALPPITAGVGNLTTIGQRVRVLLVAAALFAAVFALGLTTSELGDGTTFLYVLPVVIAAIALGRWAGLTAGLMALALFAVWAQVEQPQVGLMSYVSRAFAFALVGAVTGHMADRMRSASRRAEVAARHFDISGDMLCTASLDGYFTSVNPSWERTLGWTVQELMSRPFIELVHPDDRAETEREVERLAEGELTTSFINRYRARDGGWRWIEWQARADVPARLIYAAARDVTEARAVEHARAEAEERFRRAFEDSAMGMALVGPDDSVILAVNASLARILGTSRGELVGKMSLSELTDPEDMGAMVKGMKRLEDGEAPLFRCEVRIVRPDDRRGWVDISASIVRDEDGHPLYRLLQVVDIDARRRAETQLRHLADHDPLSGVYNRRRFEQELQRELGYSAMKRSRGAVLLLDVDSFKRINDTLGHAAGDAVIANIGHALTDRLRSIDAIGRLGGDEFAVLLRRVEAEEAHEVARSLQALALEKLAEVSGDGSDKVTLSVGVATFGVGDTPSLDQLLHIADAAMYEAKRAGGNQVAIGASP